MTDTPLKLAIFDCDGTIVDSQHSIIQAMHLTCESYGLQRLAGDQIRKIVGLPLEVGMAVLFENETNNLHIEMAEKYRDHFRDMRINGEVEEPLYQGTLEALDSLEAKDWLLGVATGKAMRGLIPTLETHGLVNKFTTLQTACRARGKPDPEMIEKALYETGVDKKNAVMIGDTTFDIHMACNANVKSIGVSWGYHDVEDLKSAGADAIIYSYSELAETIDRLMED